MPSRGRGTYDLRVDEVEEPLVVLDRGEVDEWEHIGEEEGYDDLAYLMTLSGCRGCCMDCPGP